MGFFAGHWLETHIIKMKVFAIACLIIGAFAEPEAKPEADADAYYYGNYGYGAVGSLGYAARPLVSSVGYAARPAVSSYSYAARPAVSSYNYASHPVLSSYGGYANSPYVSSYGSYGLRLLERGLLMLSQRLRL